MNKDLLFKLYCIHSESGNEKKMRRFLRKVANECGAYAIETDKYGNLLITKGQSETYPCLAAHMDQVQHKHSKDFRVVEVDGDILGWSAKSHEQQGLGADDKNGIFICLELLRKFDVMKVAFFVGEEVGNVGSSQVDLSFFKDCRFIIEPDRRGQTDLITSMYCGAVCSKKFIEDIGYKNYGYKEEHGTITDVGELVERGVGISCLNLSCGYYNAHSDEEITVLSHLENCMNFVEHIVETCKEVYPFEGGYGGYGKNYGRYGRYSNIYLDDYYDGYGYGYYGGKKYDGAKGKSSYAKTDGKSRSLTAYPSAARYQEEEEDEMYYFDGGYYDEDVNTMEEYLQLEPHLTFDQIKAFYFMDFNAFRFFDSEGCESMLEDIFSEVKEYMSPDDLGDDDDDNSVIGELSFEDVTPLKKVS